jgi:hypothetical protein
MRYLAALFMLLATHATPQACDCCTTCTCGKCQCKPERRCSDRCKCESFRSAPGSSITIAGPTFNGVEVTCDLPVSQRTKNVGGRDGAGLCVFSSIGHAARYQNEARLKDFQKDMRKEPGGGYPQKVDKMIARYGAGTQYVQYEGSEPAIIEMALRTGRMPSITYNGHCPHYGNQTIAHMVNIVYLDDKHACILDNNFIGANDLVWMSRADFLKRWRGDGGWAVVLLAPPPPPAPRN